MPTSSQSNSYQKLSSANSTLAVYAGTFDPLTNGHRDIVLRALKIFDRVMLAVAASTSKQCLFKIDERVEMLEVALSDLGNRVNVKAFDGLLVEFVRAMDAKVIVRGLRAVSDYEYEAQMAVINRRLAEDIETVFIMTSEQSSFISSSIVRDVARNGGDVSNLVPKNVAKRLQAIYTNRD